MGESENVVESEAVEEWTSGQDLSSSASEQSSMDLEQSAEQSLEQSSLNGSVDVYDMGAFTGYTLDTFPALYASGFGAGFGVAVAIALAMWALSSLIKIIKKGGQ